MDLNIFDTREKADAGVKFDLVIEGETIYGDDDKPVWFSVRGINAPDIRQCFISDQKQKPPKTPDEVDTKDMKLMRLAVNGWSDNFEINGEKLAYSRENVVKVMDVPIIRAFVAEKIMSLRDFMNRA
jgi:hypothetical protein